MSSNEKTKGSAEAYSIMNHHQNINSPVNREGNAMEDDIDKSIFELMEEIKDKADAILEENKKAPLNSLRSWIPKPAPENIEP